MRTLPLNVGDSYKFPVVSLGNCWMAEIDVVRKEYIDTPFGRKRTIVVRPETGYRGIAAKTGDSFIWFTDDEKRYPIRMDAKVKIGTIVAALKSIQAK